MYDINIKIAIQMLPIIEKILALKSFKIWGQPKTGFFIVKRGCNYLTVSPVCSIREGAVGICRVPQLLLQVIGDYLKFLFGGVAEQEIGIICVGKYSPNSSSPVMLIHQLVEHAQIEHIYNPVEPPRVEQLIGTKTNVTNTSLMGLVIFSNQFSLVVHIKTIHLVPAGKTL